MRFQPGTVAVLDLSGIAERVMVRTNDLNTYGFHEVRPYLCERVEGDVSTWLALTSNPTRRYRNILVCWADRMNWVQDPWTWLEIPNRLVRRATRTAMWGPPRMATSAEAVLADVTDHRADIPPPAGLVVRRRACDPAP